MKSVTFLQVERISESINITVRIHVEFINEIGQTTNKTHKCNIEIVGNDDEKLQRFRSFITAQQNT